MSRLEFSGRVPETEADSPRLDGQPRGLERRLGRSAEKRASRLVFYFVAGYIALVVLALLALGGCAAPRYALPAPAPGDFINLYSRGGWGTDTDIWITPDDRFIVTHFDGVKKRVEEQYQGHRPGLFQGIVRAVDRRNAWEITSAAMDRAISAEAARRGEAFGVTDLSHDCLEIKANDRTLKADFYAADIHSRHYPSVTSVRDFANIISGIWKGTKKDG